MALMKLEAGCNGLILDCPVYRVDCDGCGLKDEHDRGPDGEILYGHYAIEDAYASAACMECENSPQIMRMRDGRDLCQSCRKLSI